MKLQETFGNGRKRKVPGIRQQHTWHLQIILLLLYGVLRFHVKIFKIPESGSVLSSVLRSMIPKLREWFMSQERRALDDSVFYSEKYWMKVDEETGEGNMNI